MLTVLIGLAGIVVIAVQQALAILEKIELEGGAIDMDTISNVATQADTGSGNLAFNLLLLLIIACWIIGIVDATRIGRGKDNEHRLAKQASKGSNG